MNYAFFKAGCKSKDVYVIHKMFLKNNLKLISITSSDIANQLLAHLLYKALYIDKDM